MKKLCLSMALIIIFLCNPAAANHPDGSVYVDINGLVCDFCARALEKVFAKRKEVESIVVDLDSKIVTIHFHHGQHLDDADITKYINDAGYSVEEIRHDS